MQAQERINLKRAVVIATIIAILYPIPLIWWMRYQSARFLYRRLSPLGMHLIFLTFIAALAGLVTRKAPKKMLSKQELALIFTILASTLPIPWALGMPIYSWVLASVKVGEYPRVWEVVPVFWAPKDLGVDAIWTGNLPVSAFISMSILWTFVTLVFYLFSFSTGLLLRKPFLEDEKLPYPLTLPATFVIEEATSYMKEGELPNLLKSKLFWLTFFIGWLINFYYSPTGGGGQGAGLELLLKYPSPEPYMPYTYLSGKLPSPFTNIVMAWDFDALGMGLYLLFPLDILLTGIIFHVLCYILWPIIQLSMGLVKPQFGAGEWGAFGTVNSVGFIPSVFLDAGGCIGFGLLTLWIIRKHVVESIKRAIEGASDEKPFSYRTIWTAIIVSAVLILLFLIASGAHPVTAFVTLIYLWFWVILLARIRGEVWPGYSNAWGVCQQHTGIYIIIPAAVEQAVTGTPTGVPVSIEVARSIYVCGGFHGVISEYGKWVPAIAALESLKVAEQAKLDYRKAVLAAAPAVIAVTLLTFIFLTVNVATFGAKTFLSDWWTGWQFAWIANPFVAESLRSGIPARSVDWIVSLVLGILVAIGLGVARVTIPRFPLNPLGMIMFSVSFYGFAYGLLAFIIKYSILKIAGAKAWESKGLPIALGLFLGGYTGFYPTRALINFLLGR